MKKYIARFLVMIMVLSIFTGCGQSSNTDVQNNGTVKSDANTTDNTNQPDSKEEAKDSAKEETARADQISFYASKEDKGVRSALITFEPDKVRLDEEDAVSYSNQSFEIIGAEGMTIKVECEAETAQSLYENAINGYREDIREEFTTSELKEVTINDSVCKGWDVFRKGKLLDKFYACEIGNGLTVTLETYNGYEEDADYAKFEEAVNYVLLAIEEGDGTIVRPPLDFDVQKDDNVLSITFESGNTFQLDYDETKCQLINSGTVLYIDYIDGQGQPLGNMNMNLYISNKYASFEEYYNAEYSWIPDNREQTFPIATTTLNGVEVTYAYSDMNCSGIYAIELSDGYMLRGDYRTDSENVVTLPNALAILLGVAVVEPEKTEEPLVYEACHEITGQTVYFIEYDTSAIEIRPDVPALFGMEARWMEDKEDYYRISMRFGGYSSCSKFMELRESDYHGNSIYDNVEFAYVGSMEFGNVVFEIISVNYQNKGNDYTDILFYAEPLSSVSITGTFAKTTMEEAELIFEALFKNVESTEEELMDPEEAGDKMKEELIKLMESEK